VEYILNLLTHDSTAREILDEYEGLQPENIQACLLFASQSLFSTAPSCHGSRSVTLTICPRRMPPNLTETPAFTTHSAPGIRR